MRQQKSKSAIYVQLIRFLLVCFLVANFTLHATPTPQKKILILNSYHQGYLWSDEIIKGIEVASQNSNNEISFYIEYMDSKRVPIKKATSETLKSLNKKYHLGSDKQKGLFDLIITADDNALNFMLDHQKTLCPDTPIVFCGINNLPAALEIPQPNITGVISEIDLLSLLNFALKAHPKTNEILFLSDHTPSGQAIEDQGKASLANFPIPTKFISGKDYTHNEFFRMISSLPKNKIVLLGVWTKDKNQNFIKAEDFISQLTRASKSPVYSCVDLRKGVVGGKTNTGRHHGQAAFTIANKILNGTKAENIPIEHQKATVWYFDVKAIKKWGISPSFLPPDARLINKSANPIQEYKYPITGIILIFFFQTIVIVLLLSEKRKRIAAEKKQKKIERDILLVSKSLQQSIAFMDRDLRVIWVNRVPDHVNGIPEDFIGRQCFKIAYGRDKPCDGCPGPVVIATKKPMLKEIKTQAGKIIRKEVFPVFDEAGQEIIGIIETNLDVTEQKIAQKQAIQAQKMEATGQLAGGLAHDFNNIMQAISGYIELTKAEISDNTSAQSYLDMGLKACDMGKSLIKQLLTFSRSDKATEFKPINLNKIIKQFSKLIKRVIPSNIEFQFNPPTENHWILGDKGKIEQILMNLCLNAKDAMPNGGKLIVEISTINAKYELVSESNKQLTGKYIILTITDTGIGINQENQEKIFEPFFTTKKETHGTGLGLATVYGIVQEHDGAISVKSSINKGTTFKILLPQTKHQPIEDESDITDEENLFSQIKGNGEIILIAEDNKLVRRLIKKILTKANYRVISASDGQEAVDLLTKHSDEIDLLLLDLMMPKYTGMEVSKKARSIKSDYPILYCSGYTKEQLDQKPDGEIIQKPFTKTTLLEAVKRSLKN